MTSKEALLSLLTGKVTVFMGQTGVGKSTLLNKLEPDLNLEAGEISDSLGRGRHTTRAVSFYNLNGGKNRRYTRLFFSVYYEVSRAEDLNQAFQRLLLLAEIVSSMLVPYHEPSCAVKPAVEEGRYVQPSVLIITCNSLVN